MSGQIVNIAKLRALEREKPVMLRLFMIRNMAHWRKYEIIQINKILQHHSQGKVRESSLFMNKVLFYSNRKTQINNKQDLKTQSPKASDYKALMLIFDS